MTIGCTEFAFGSCNLEELQCINSAVTSGEFPNNNNNNNNITNNKNILSNLSGKGIEFYNSINNSRKFNIFHNNLWISDEINKMIKIKNFSIAKKDNQIVQKYRSYTTSLEIE